MKKYAILVLTFVLGMTGLLFQTEMAQEVCADINVLGTMYTAVCFTIFGSELFEVFPKLSGKRREYMIFIIIIGVVSCVVFGWFIHNDFAVNLGASLIGICASGTYAVYQKRR